MYLDFLRLFAGEKHFFYCIYLAIRWFFPSLERLQITKSVLRKFAVIQVLPFHNNPKDLDLSYKTDVDFWDGFGLKQLCLVTKEILYITQEIQ